MLLSARNGVLNWRHPLTIAVVLWALVPATVVSQTPPAAADTLTVAAAVRLTLEQNPRLHAERLRTDAAFQRIAPAGALPDPQLTLGLQNRPVDNFGTDPMMLMNSVQLVQRFPWPGKLGFSKQRSRRLAEARELDADETEVSMIARLKSIYYRTAFMDRALVIMRETRKLLRDFLTVSEARYAVGSGLQQDVLQAQVAIAQMTEDITTLQQNRIAMAARLNALMGRDATTPVGALELPELLDSLEPLDSLFARAVLNRPALLAAGKRVEAAEQGYRAARRRLYPDFTVTLKYGQRPRFDDLATVMVGINIPLWAGKKQIPFRREMSAMKSAEEARALDLYNETYARLAELRAEAQRTRNLQRLYLTAVLPQARAAVESALSAYRVGNVDYMTLLQNEMTVNRYEIEVVRLTAGYHEALAEIDALLGATRGESD